MAGSSRSGRFLRKTSTRAGRYSAAAAPSRLIAALVFHRLSAAREARADRPTARRACRFPDPPQRRPNSRRRARRAPKSDLFVMLSGVKMPSLRAFLRMPMMRCPFRFVEVRVDIGLGELQPRERRRLGRKRLRRRRMLARHVALRHWPLFDRPDRLARDAIEHIQQTELRRLRNDVDRLAVVLHRQAALAR